MSMQRGLCGLGPVKIRPARKEPETASPVCKLFGKATAHLTGCSIIKNLHHDPLELWSW